MLFSAKFPTASYNGAHAEMPNFRNRMIERKVLFDGGLDYAHPQVAWLELQDRRVGSSIHKQESKNPTF